jgi:DNA-binding MarR family transcriptional regulator
VTKKLLSRTADEDDARQGRLQLTARGRRIQQAILRSAAKRSAFLAQGTSAARLARLHRELDRLLERAAELLRQAK